MTTETVMASACETVRERLAAAVDGDVDGDVALHVGTCLRCQAEVVQYKKLGRGLRSLQAQIAVPPMTLHAAVMEAVARAQGRATRLWKGALIGAGSLLGAGGITAGILITRHRQRLAS